MDRQNLKFYLFLLLLVSFFLLAACSSRFGETDLAVEEDAIEQPEPTVEIMPLEDLEEWDLVWVTDSSGWGVAQVYGEMVAKDTGKTVSVGDYWEGGFAAGEMVEILRGEYQGGDYKFKNFQKGSGKRKLWSFMVIHGHQSMNRDRGIGNVFRLGHGM